MPESLTLWMFYENQQKSPSHIDHAGAVTEAGSSHSCVLQYKSHLPAIEYTSILLLESLSNTQDDSIEIAHAQFASIFVHSFFNGLIDAMYRLHRNESECAMLMIILSYGNDSSCSSYGRRDS